MINKLKKNPPRSDLKSQYGDGFRQVSEKEVYYILVVCAKLCKVYEISLITFFRKWKMAAVTFSLTAVCLHIFRVLTLNTF